MNTAQRPIRIAIVGHTNTGKTSVIRSLLRDHTLGNVRDEAATTRTVTPYPVTINAVNFGQIIDTPGLEDAGAILAHVRHRERQHRVSPAQALNDIVHAHAHTNEPASHHAPNDLLPLQALANCDAGVVVFDAREPPLDKYWEEHELLSKRGVPIVGLLNCIATHNNLSQQWEQRLRREGMNAIVSYDSWAASEHDAQRLFDKIRELVDNDTAAAIANLQRARRAAESAATERTAAALAESLTALASFRKRIHREATPDDTPLRSAFAAAWTRFTERTADAWGLSHAQLHAIEAELAQPAKADDHAHAAARASIGGGIGALGGGVLALATQGLLVDAAAGGATLGLGALGGATIGSAIAGKQLARAAIHRLRNQRELRFAPEALDETLRRGVWLARRVRLFGAASERPLQPPQPDANEPTTAPTLDAARKQLRRTPPAPPSPHDQLPQTTHHHATAKLERTLTTLITDNHHDNDNRQP